jgi:hypothetical protein
MTNRSARAQTNNGLNSLAVSNNAGKNSASTTSMDRRLACVLVFNAATTRPRALRNGTASDSKSTSISWSIKHHPCDRTSVNRARNTQGSTAVNGVSFSNFAVSNQASSSASGNAASNTRPMDVHHAGKCVPTSRCNDAIRFRVDRAT